MKIIKSFGFIILIGIIIGAVLYYFETKKILSFPPTAWTTSVEGDCAVVLTGAPGRVREGFDLLAQKRIKKLIISGVYQHTELSDIFPVWPFYSDINENDIVLEKRSGTTYGNAQQSLPLVEALKCRSLVLITSRLHMFRSLKIFQAAFPQDFPIYPRAVVSGRLDPRMDDVFFEATKSIFYSFWAY